jgi:hypothetical protein
MAYLEISGRAGRSDRISVIFLFLGHYSPLTAISLAWYVGAIILGLGGWLRGLPMSIDSADAQEVTPDTTTVPLQSHEIEVLREIIEIYRASKLDLSLVRPRFKKPRSNSGILLNDEIRIRALEKAKADPDTTGGSLSALVELMLWRYLGSPSDVVEGSDSEE